MNIYFVIDTYMQRETDSQVHQLHREYVDRENKKMRVYAHTKAQKDTQL